MHPVAILVVENARKNSHLLAPLLFVVSSAIAHVHSPVQHQLFVTCVSWALVCIYALLRAGFGFDNVEKRRITQGWLAGGFLALSAICDRAACDREGIWSMKAFFALFVVFLSENDVLSKYITPPSSRPFADSPIDNSSSSDPPQSRSYRLLAVIVVSASFIFATDFTTSSTSVLGLSSAIFAATGLIILDNALKFTADGNSGRSGFMSANGSFSHLSSGDGVQKEQRIALLRDVAAVMATVCGVAMFLMEPPLKPKAVTWVPLYHELPKGWKDLQRDKIVQQVLLMIPITVITNVLMFIMASPIHT
jgi:hypothetical protein